MKTYVKYFDIKKTVLQLIDTVVSIILFSVTFLKRCFLILDYSILGLHYYYY